MPESSSSVNAVSILSMFHVIHEQEETSASQSNDDKPRKRISYSREQKLAAIAYATTTFRQKKNGTMTPITMYEAAKELGITPTMLRNWINGVNSITLQKKGTRRHAKIHPAKEPQMEALLYAQFVEKRDSGRTINARWFNRNARRIYTELYPTRVMKNTQGRLNYAGFRFSGGWFTGFKRRYGIVPRDKTKMAQKKLEDLRNLIQSWLQFNRRMSQSLSDPPCEVGRFYLSEISNVDQIPLSFEFLDGRTYDKKGSKTVFAKIAESGWDKRQATLQILVHADGIPRCKPLLLFHGKRDVQHSRIAAKSQQYDSRVVVKFNEKAYANEAVMLDWIENQYKWSTAYPWQNRPRLLSLDVFEGQKTPAVLQALRKMNTAPSFIPRGCTGYVQVLDVAINKTLKQRIAELADEHYDNHIEQWNSGKYTIGQRRVMITHWVGQAWADIHSTLADTIRQTFRNVGLALAVDGSEDSELHIRDFPGIEVGDWRLNMSMKGTEISKATEATEATEVTKEVTKAAKATEATEAAEVVEATEAAEATEATEATGMNLEMRKNIEVESGGDEMEGFDPGTDSEANDSDIDAEGEVDMGVIYE